MTVRATKMVKIWARAELHVLAWILSLIMSVSPRGIFLFQKSEEPRRPGGLKGSSTGVQGGLVV
jgi:hypothetical protein